MLSLDISDNDEVHKFVTEEVIILQFSILSAINLWYKHLRAETV